MNETAIGAIGMAAGAVITALVAGYLKIAGDRHKQRTEEHGTTIGEFRELVDRREADNAVLRQEIAAMRAEMAAMRHKKEMLIVKASDFAQRFAAAKERIESLQETLTANKIPFRPWAPSGTGDSVAEMETQQ